MKYLFVGDIHGDITITEYVLNKFENTHKIFFIGDLVDSFQFSIIEQVECLLLVLEAAEHKKCVYIPGNHEFNYLGPKDICRCSGFNSVTDAHLIHLKNRLLNVFTYFYFDKENKILVTHAGLTKSLIKYYKITVDNIEEILTKWSHDYTSPFYYIGRSRFGKDDIGGPLWCDWNREFENCNWLTQILGHSSALSNKEKHDKKFGIRYFDQTYNIDCLLRTIEFLEFDTDTQKFTIIH